MGNGFHMFENESELANTGVQLNTYPNHCSDDRNAIRGSLAGGKATTEKCTLSTMSEFIFIV
jgi:hypothetical protein